MSHFLVSEFNWFIWTGWLGINLKGKQLTATKIKNLQK
jgi:hypothetical protein